MAGGADHRSGRQAARRGRRRVAAAAAQWPCRRHRRRRRGRSSRCGPTSTRSRSTTVAVSRGAAPCPGVAHACGHDVHTAALVGAGLALAAPHHAAEPLPGRVRLLFQPAEEIMPGGALELISGGALDGVDARLRTALRPEPSTSARSACARARSPAPPTRSDGAAHRPRRPHLAAAPHRGPDLRARQARHRAPGSALPAAGPAGGREPGLGDGPRRLGQERHPGQPARSPAPCGCSTRWPGPTPRTWSAS